MQEILVTNRVSNRLKNIKIEVKQNGEIVLSRPKHVSEKKALEFFNKNKEWVIKSYEKVLSVKPKDLKYEDGDKIYYLGCAYTLKVNEVKLLNKINQTENYIFKKTLKSIIVLDIANNILEMYVKEKYNTMEIRKNEILNFLAEEARKNIDNRLIIYKEKMNLSFNNFRIKDTKTRWGSCSSNKNLNFNYKLILAPQWVIDYVVVHELSHLKFMDHSKNFWNLVSIYSPKYKEAKKWFKENNNIFNI